VYQEPVHDPGLTPVGKLQARLFHRYYQYHMRPTLVLTSPLRRCLQTTRIVFGPLIQSGELRALAHPGLQEVSESLCDTGNPLSVLRNEYPEIEFLDEHFPAVWPRMLRPWKAGTIYADNPERLLQRAEGFREWLRNVKDTEIIVVTHGGFVQFFFDNWEGFPGSSVSYGPELGNAEAFPMTLPGPQCQDGRFRRCPLDIRPGPEYPNLWTEDPGN